MPAWSGAGAILQSQHDQLGITGGAIRHLNGLALPEQQGPLSAFLYGLQKFRVMLLPVKYNSGAKTDLGCSGFQAEARCHGFYKLLPDGRPVQCWSARAAS